MAKKRLAVLVEQKLLKEFKTLAEERGHTMTWYVNRWVADLVTRAQEERGASNQKGKQSEK